MNEFNWDKVTKNNEVIKLLKEREELEAKIKNIELMALVNYEIEKLNF